MVVTSSKLVAVDVTRKLVTPQVAALACAASFPGHTHPTAHLTLAAEV